MSVNGVACSFLGSDRLMAHPVEDFGVELSTPPMLDSNDNESVDEELDDGVSPRERLLAAVIGEI